MTVGPRSRRFLVWPAFLALAACGHSQLRAREQMTCGFEVGQRVERQAHRERVSQWQASRSKEDVALDTEYAPTVFLGYFSLLPTDRHDRRQYVAMLGDSSGYMTEYLAHNFEGKVYALGPKPAAGSLDEASWLTRAPRLLDVTRIEQAFDAPFPEVARNLDAVLMHFSYHDAVATKVERSKMLAAVFLALRSGGTFGIFDYNARPGAGFSDAESLHRVEDIAVKQEVTAAGFVFVGQESFLRTADDPRDWDPVVVASPRTKRPLDRFALRFTKGLDAGKP